MASEDAQEIADLLDAVTGRVPTLLRSVLDQLYSPEAGRQMGRAIGIFYKELTEAGLPPDRALQLAEGYASPLQVLRSVLGETAGAGGPQGVSWSFSQGGRRKPERPPAPAPAGPLPLEACFNNAGTSDDGAPERADLDGLGWSLSAQALAAAGVVPGGTITVDGLEFRWPEPGPGQPNNVEARGQRIRLPGRPGARRLGFLGLATHGPAAGLATLHYADGRSQPVALAFPDWALDGGEQELPPATRVAVRMPRRNGRDREAGDGEFAVFCVSLPLPGGAAPESVTLPARLDRGALHVFAVALGD
jgi:hypothetical protein